MRYPVNFVNEFEKVKMDCSKSQKISIFKVFSIKNNLE
jgi:hypothetical protein